MKAKLGLAVGVNVAVACLLMQGCKAPRVTDNNYGNDVKMIESQPTQPQPTDDIKVAATPAPDAAPVEVKGVNGKDGKSAKPVAKTADKTADVVVETAPAVPVVAAPAAVPVATAPVADEAFTLYTVRPGDMISRIARRYNIRQKAILDMNPGLVPNKLYAGKKIKLPASVKLDAAPAAAPAAAPVAANVKAPKTVQSVKFTGATKEYVVKSGDSLSVIAKKNGTNVRTIKEINGLSGDRVRVGQKLKIPAEKAAAAVPPAAKAEGKRKLFAKKDEAKAAVKKPVEKKAAVAADASKAAEVKEAAPKVEAPAVQPVAPKVEAPAAQPVAPAADAVQPTVDAVATPQPAAADAATAPAATPAAAPEMHTVKEGEDVVSIAISYGVSPSTLMDANDLKSSEVKPGDVLKIPPKNAQ